MSDLHARYNEVEKLIDDEKFEEAIAGLRDRGRGRGIRARPPGTGSRLHQDGPARLGDRARAEGV